MDKSFAEYAEVFRSALFDDMLPLWDKYGLDWEYGGYLHGFDRHWITYDTDKMVWTEGRYIWLYSKFYNEVEKKPEWLKAAKLGYDFMNKYCFAPDGHMYFRVTREGKPLQLRRYYFSEAFAVAGYIEYYKATGDGDARCRAIDVFNKMVKYYKTPGYFPPKLDPKTRKYKGHSINMTMFNVSRAIKEIYDDPVCDEIMNSCLNAIAYQFYKPEMGVLLETLAPDGEFVDDPEGRVINPGHALESAWFIMEEAVARGDKELMERAIEITNCSLKWGWDEEMNGIMYFRDIKGFPSPRVEWDMKLLWPHCEAMCALVFAYRYTEDGKYMEEFEKIFKYTFDYFLDKEYGGWYGTLHRDGMPLNYCKGATYKTMFHEARAFYVIYRALEAIANGMDLPIQASVL